jgi:hypothetical protein
MRRASRTYVYLGAMMRFLLASTLALSLVGCGADSTDRLTDGRAGDGFRYNIALPEPPAVRDDDGAGVPSAGAGTASALGSAGAADCVAAINDYRAQVGAAPLERWSEAEACTAGECRDDAMSKQPHGSFGACSELGQNECPGWLGWRGDPAVALSKCLADMWAEGPGGGHHDNMRRTTWRKVACAAHVAANGEVTAIQNFR